MSVVSTEATYKLMVVLMLFFQPYPSAVCLARCCHCDVRARRTPQRPLSVYTDQLLPVQPPATARFPGRRQLLQVIVSSKKDIL